MDQNTFYAVLSNLQLEQEGRRPISDLFKQGAHLNHLDIDVKLGVWAKLPWSRVVQFEVFKN